MSGGVGVQEKELLDDLMDVPVFVVNQFQCEFCHVLGFARNCEPPTVRPGENESEGSCGTSQTSTERR